MRKEKTGTDESSVTINHKNFFLHSTMHTAIIKTIIASIFDLSSTKNQLKVYNFFDLSLTSVLSLEKFHFTQKFVEKTNFLY